MSERVSLVKYQEKGGSIDKSLELIGGFSTLRKDDKVLLKPNLVLLEDPVIPYGVFTTTRLVEDLLIMLKDYGCTNIAIGEGSIISQSGGGTMEAFNVLGYRELSKRYGVSLINFNHSESSRIKVEEGLTLDIAREALEADFVINLPVLKTHSITKVSLGLKNLKGCLKARSKKTCHHARFDLEYCFQFIADYVKPSLTIVDGIYALEKGPLTLGIAYRKNVVIASKDILAADMVAAKTIGFSPDEIVHIKEYAGRHGKSLKLGDYEIWGDTLEEHITPLKWDWVWNDSDTGPLAFDRAGLQGIAVPKYDKSVCSGCVPLSGAANVLLLSASGKGPFPKVELIMGRRQARQGYEKTLLIGDCAVHSNKSNPNIKQAIPLRGCSPRFDGIADILYDIGIKVKKEAYREFMDRQAARYYGKDEYSWNFFSLLHHQMPAGNPGGMMER